MYTITKWISVSKSPQQKWYPKNCFLSVSGQQGNFNKVIKSISRDMSTRIKSIDLTNVIIRCYNFVSGLSCGNRTRRPLRASSSSIQRMPLMSLAKLMLSFDSLLLSADNWSSSMTWKSNGWSLLGLLPSISSVCVSAVFMPISSPSLDDNALFWPRISVANDSAFPTAGQRTTSETFCHKTWRKFFKVTSFCRFRDWSARDNMKNFFSREDRVELLTDFCRSRWFFSSQGDEASSVSGGVTCLSL